MLRGHIHEWRRTNFENFRPPSPLCHAKMAILLTTLFRLSHKSEPPSCVTLIMNVPLESYTIQPEKMF